MKATAPTDRILRAESIRLARLAVDLDEIVERLAGEYLTAGGALLLTAPAHHLALSLGRLEQLIYEATEKLDDRPRLERLAEAA